jgi:hypothetical protein
MNTHKTIPSFRLLASITSLWLAMSAHCQAVSVSVSLRVPLNPTISIPDVYLHNQFGESVELTNGSPQIGGAFGCYTYGFLPDDPTVEGWYFDESVEYSKLEVSFELPESMIGKQVSFHFPCSPYPGRYTSLITVQPEGVSSEQLFLTETSPPVVLTEIDAHLQVNGNVFFNRALDIYGSLLNLGTDPANGHLLFNWTAARLGSGAAAQSVLQSRSDSPSARWTWEAGTNPLPILKIEATSTSRTVAIEGNLLLNGVAVFAGPGPVDTFPRLKVGWACPGLMDTLGAAGWWSLV